MPYDEYGWDVVGDFKMVAFLMDLQNGIYEVSLLSLPLGAQGQQVALPQAELATADRVLCWEEQRQVGVTGGPRRC